MSKSLLINSAFVVPGLGKTLFGTPGPDNYTGTDNFDTLNGADGADTIHLRGGISDFSDGGAGNDRIWGEAGIDNIHGGADNDYINGGIGNDFLWGDDGKDTVVGGDGDDTIYFGAGNDKGTGGNGHDTFAFDFTNIGGGLGVDKITDFHAKPAGHDKLDLRQWSFTWAARDKGMEDGAEILKYNGGADTVIHLKNALGFTGTIILTGVHLVDIDKGDFLLA